jgi:hypothetical protein
MIAEGDELRRSGNLDEALDRYREASERSDLGGTERERILRARGEILLQRGDPHGAEQSIRRMSDSGTRSWLLGRAARAEGDRARAEALDREGLAKGERNAGLDLAELVGSEAATPDRLLEAAHLLADSGGDPEQAKAAETAARVWEGAARGEAPVTLLARLEAVRAQAPKYVSIELLRCDLLQRAQDPKADTAYEALASFTPTPSAVFLKRVTEQRAAGAARSGNVSELESALKLLPPEEAAARRAELARSLEAAGDDRGALELWQKTALAGSGAAARAELEVARIEEARGHPDEAAKALERARAVKDPDAESRALLALEQARLGDPLGARDALDEASLSSALPLELREETARFARGARLLGDALDALATDDPVRARTLARASVAASAELTVVSSVIGADPGAGDPVKGAWAEAAALAAIPASGPTRAALLRAAVGRLCGAALFPEAVELATGDATEVVLAALTELAPTAVARLLEVGRVDDAAKLWKALKEKSLLARAGELAGRGRGDAEFAALWSRDDFLGAVGPPDPLARRAPYACRLVLAGGESLGVVRVVAADDQGLTVLVPGRATPLLVAKAKLAPFSARGVPDAEADRVFRAAAELVRSPAGEER